jgi:hypothetical protein
LFIAFIFLNLLKFETTIWPGVGHYKLMPLIVATLKAEIGKIAN